ncbi:hypothetical protein ACFQHW_11500 [Lapidilactobacillus achengensis]|uniref:Uncharacterized protein n=1 Tax=Lapidilactobacillus achengensis TaxID=2486000 RepID=A0ABW1USK5_9LACO|nr:hypothetical protein [Lapidilactobacillus achengensis]
MKIVTTNHDRQLRGSSAIDHNFASWRERSNDCQKLERLERIVVLKLVNLPIWLLGRIEPFCNQGEGFGEVVLQARGQNDGPL